MKKILSLLTALTLTASGASSVISCGTKTPNKDQQKANEIVTTLKKAKIDPIKLDINGNKQTLSDYFTNIKKILDAKLTDAEKKYNYSLVNNDKITNIAKNFNVKIKVGSATSSSSFVLKVSLNYKKVTKDNGGIPAANVIDEVIKFKTSIYVATDKGLYVSKDTTGTNFTTVNNDVLKTKDIQAMFVVKDKIYIAVHIGSSNNDLYTSTDGKTFTKLTSGIPVNLQIDSISSFKDKIYVGTETGLYVSSDGKSFTKVTDSTLKTPYILNMFASKDNIYIGTRTKGLYVSSDGTTFKQAPGVPSDSMIGTISQIGTKIYVGTARKGYYLSSDGTNFTQQSQFKDKGVAVITKIGTNIYVGVVTMSSTSPPTFTGTYYISSDDGKTFSNLEEQFANAPARLIKQINNNMIYIGTEKGLYYNFVS